MSSKYRDYHHMKEYDSDSSDCSDYYGSDYEYDHPHSFVTSNPNRQEPLGHMEPKFYKTHCPGFRAPPLGFWFEGTLGSFDEEKPIAYIVPTFPKGWFSSANTGLSSRMQTVSLVGEKIEFNDYHEYDDDDEKDFLHFEKYLEKLNVFYAGMKAQSVIKEYYTLQQYEPGQLVVAYKKSANRFVRAMIVKTLDNGKVLIRGVDSGIVSTAPKKTLINISDWLCRQTFMAVPFTMDLGENMNMNLMQRIIELYPLKGYTRISGTLTKIEPDHEEQFIRIDLADVVLHPDEGAPRKMKPIDLKSHLEFYRDFVETPST